MTDIDTQAAHKAVDFLADFQKSNGAEKPDKDIARYGFPAACVHLRLHITFRYGKGCGGKGKGK